MGWTFQHRDRGITDRAFFQDLLGDKQEILASATVGRTTFYAAVRSLRTGEVWAFVALTRWVRGDFNYGYKDMDERMGPTEALCPPALLDLLSPLGECNHPEQYCRWCSDLITPDGDRWVYTPAKGQVAECGGPRCYSGYMVSAPRPEDGGKPYHEPGGIGLCGSCCAREWRAECRQAAERAALARTVKPGTLVKFARPIRFQSGAELDTFVFEARNTFRGAGPQYWGRYRLTGWRHGTFEVLPASQPA